MHIIIGGAYNGKRHYVEQQIVGQDVVWCHGSLAILKQSEQQELLVISGIEKMLGDDLLEEETVQAHTLFDTLMTRSAGFKKVYIILVDQSRGIVPINAEQRKLRDVLGRLYQLLMAEAQTVTRIWYGLPQQIK